MKKSLILFVCLFISTISWAQDDVPPSPEIFKKAGKFGVKYDGEIKIQPVYDKITSFYEKEEWLGIEETYYLNISVLLLSKDGKQQLVETQEDWNPFPTEGFEKFELKITDVYKDKYLCIAQQNGKQGLYDVFGHKWLFPPSHTKLDFFDENRLTVEVDGKLGLIDMENNLLTEVIYPNIQPSVLTNYVQVKLNNGNFNLYQLKDGKAVDYSSGNFSFETLGVFRHDGNKAFYYVNNKKGIVDLTNFKVILPAIYDKIYFSPYNDRFLLANKGGKTGVFEWKTNEIEQIIPIIYDSIKPEGKTIFTLNRDKKWGLYDSSKMKIEEMEYPYSKLKRLFYDHGIIVTDQNGKEGLVNMKLETVIPPKYDSFKLLNKFTNPTDIFEVSIEDKISYIILTKGLSVPVVEYQSLSKLYKGRNSPMIAKKEGKYGLINHRTGKILVPFEYDTIEYAAANSVKATKNGKTERKTF